MDDLADWRRQLDGIDEQLVYLLAERFSITDQIGQYKAQKGLKPFDPKREAVILDRLSRLAKSSSLNPQLIEHLYSIILDYSKDSQAKVATNQLRTV